MSTYVKIFYNFLLLVTIILAQVERRFMTKEKNNEKKYYKKKYKPFYNNLNNYLKTFIIPEVIAFYLASSYEHDCLDKCSIENHLNSAMIFFNININVNKLIPKIKYILNIRYNLKILNENPLILKHK